MAVNVNRPTNKKEKEADVNRKLQLYGIVSAFQQGKVPSVSIYLLYQRRANSFNEIPELDEEFGISVTNMLLE